MKRAILPALVLAFLIAIPAVSQDGGTEDELAAKVEKLQEKVDQQELQLKRLETYAAATKAQAATLLKKLKFADEKGFIYPAPHTDARKALLYGLQDFASVASGGAPAKRETKSGD